MKTLVCQEIPQKQKIKKGNHKVIKTHQAWIENLGQAIGDGAMFIVFQIKKK